MKNLYIATIIFLSLFSTTLVTAEPLQDYEDFNLFTRPSALTLGGSFLSLPNLPTQGFEKFDDCVAFENEVNDLLATTREQHDMCLEHNHAQPSQSSVCSHPACNDLHVLRDSILSKYLKNVTACYKNATINNGGVFGTYDGNRNSSNSEQPTSEGGSCVYKSLGSYECFNVESELQCKSIAFNGQYDSVSTCESLGL